VELEHAVNAGAGGTLGAVALPAGEVAVRLQGKGVTGEGLMNLRRLRLAPEQLRSLG
jgi:hypothetical protein